jgi:hypothetical protein
MSGLVAKTPNEIGLGGAFESGGFVGFAFLLEGAEFGRLLFAAAGEAGFLKLQIAKLLFVHEQDVDLDHGDAVGVVVFGVKSRDFKAATAHEGHFQAGEPVETPTQVGDGLHESAFFGTDGLKLFFVSQDVRLVERGVIPGKEDGLAGESCFNGVEADGGFALLGFRAGGELRVRLVSDDFEIGRPCVFPIRLQQDGKPRDAQLWR